MYDFLIPAHEVYYLKALFIGLLFAFEISQSVLLEDSQFDWIIGTVVMKNHLRLMNKMGCADHCGTHVKQKTHGCLFQG